MKGKNWLMDFDKAFLNSIVNAICTEFLDDIAYALVHDQVVKISSAEIETIGMCDIVMARWTGYEDNNNFVIICGPVGFTTGDMIYFKIRVDVIERMTDALLKAYQM